MSVSSDEIVLAALELIESAEGEFHLRASGSSMSPLIREGDLLVVQRQQSGMLPGQILVFRDGDQLTAHRLLQLPGGETGAAKTMGDNTENADPPIYPVQWFGIVRAIQRDQRWMALDTRAWSRINPLLSRMGMARSNLSGRGNGQPSHLKRWMIQATRIGYYLMLLFITTAIGRWQD